MCGLVYKKSFTKENVIPKLIERYEAQKTRGQEGFGAFFPASQMVYRSETEKQIVDLLNDSEEHEVLFHHRTPTSTANVVNAAHPFSTGRMFKHNYVLAHNGIIWNDYDLNKKHREERGIIYSSTQENGKFNDSEALLWEMAMYLEGMTDSPSTQGGAAFIVVEQKFNKKDELKPYKLHFGRNDANPLWMQLDDSGLTLASEHATGDEAKEIVPNFLYTFNYRSKVLSLKPMKLALYTHVSPGYSGRGGQWVQGQGWVAADGSSWEPKNSESEDDYYQRLAEEYGDDKTETKLITPADDEDDLERAADSYLADMMDRYPTMDEVEERIGADLRRARQAVTQLGEVVHGGKTKSRVVKKYYKYLRFSKVCIRAAAMYTLIVDDEDISTKATEMINNET